MSQFNYYGYSITVSQNKGNYEYVVESKYLQNKQQVDGFSSENEAFEDACNRIDAILESLV